MFGVRHARIDQFTGKGALCRPWLYGTRARVVSCRVVHVMWYALINSRQIPSKKPRKYSASQR